MNFGYPAPYRYPPQYLERVTPPRDGHSTLFPNGGSDPTARPKSGGKQSTYAPPGPAQTSDPGA
eukprot:913950-Rhodomonas_salina.1